MPSFDIVSNVNRHELTNALDQANREVKTRFDLKDSDANFTLTEDKILCVAKTNFHLKLMKDVLLAKVAKRQVDIKVLAYQEPEISNMQARQEIQIQQGISQEIAKTIIKFIKDEKMKVQASIQGEQVRITAKKRDDLQLVITTLRKKDFNLPLQFENFRD